MFLLVSITSGAAFLTSYTLLHILGLTSLWMRYFLVCVAAYGVFLLLLWLWLRTRLEDFSDIGEISDLPGLSLGNSTSEILGSGGNFGGGGASGSFDEAPPVPAGLGLISKGENPVVEALGTAGEAEEFALPLIVLILIVTVVLSAAFVVYSAPILFAELLVDSLLAAGQKNENCRHTTLDDHRNQTYHTTFRNHYYRIGYCWICATGIRTKG